LRLRAADCVAALLAWRALGVEVVVWENAPCHRAQWVREVGVRLVLLPAYLPKLNPVERVFCEVRRCVAGEVYGAMEAKVAAVEEALRWSSASSARMVGLVIWDWIREAFSGLPSD
jgi:hypothetical protein